MVKKKKKLRKKEVKKKVSELIEKARKSKSKKESDRKIRKARRTAMKNRYKIPSDLKKSFCKHCYVLFKPGENCRIRTKDGKIIYYCFECKKYTRFPFKKEQKERRKKKIKNNKGNVK